MLKEIWQYIVMKISNEDSILVILFIAMLILLTVTTSTHF